ncbi:MAG: S-layer homology domain-containing protein [Acidimicrobiia bacterium]|nr:S-layer homology domain-containing protein [Acidimicrobiia bacterium]
MSKQTVPDFTPARHTDFVHRLLVIGSVAIALFVGLLGDAPDALAERVLTGRVLDLDGNPLEGAVVRGGEITARTGSDGRFLLGAFPIGSLTIERPAYRPREVEWDGTTGLTFRLVPRIVRALHVAGWVAASETGFAEMLRLAETSAVNALVIDIRNENGLIYHWSGVADVAAMGAQANPSFDLAERVARAHDAGLYVITRIVTFQDPIAGWARPSWAVVDSGTGGPLNKGGQVFLDPTDPAPRAYAMALAQEACSAGVDEIQFDYVRFPDGGGEYSRFDGPADAASRQATITAFLADARSKLLPQVCATAADIFGWITNTPTEGGIGQHFESIIGAVDVVSPMIYPSHYSSGWYGFSVPNDHPREVVTFASQDALARMGGSTVVLRPWIQDFWYSAGQVRAQVEAMDDLGLGWMSWNILSEFTGGAYPADGGLRAGGTSPPPEPLPSSGFWDVGNGHVFSGDVAWLARENVTRGCNAPWNDEFCPEDPVTRGEMAAFLVRALDLPAGEALFTDAAGSGFESDIAALYSAGITRGCDVNDPTSFCPDDPVTRGEMAAFLVRALDLPSAQSIFFDAAGSVFEPEIGALAASGVTNGCDPLDNTRFCPYAPVTRGQMAAFLRRSLDR